MQRATGLQFYYAIVDPKVANKILLRNSLICNSFQVISDFTNYGRY